MRVRDSKRHLSPALGFVLAWLLYPPVGHAAGSSIPHGTLELIAENQWITIGHTCYLGLHFQLEKGWHIYWINPGDSGQPPTVKWQLPPGLSAGPIEWPTPLRLGTPSIVDFGYEDAVTLVVPVHSDTSFPAQHQAQLRAEIRVLVCREVCIPGKTQVSLTLPVKAQPPAADMRTRELFASARKELPRPAPRNWMFGVSDGKDSFVLSANVGSQIRNAKFFPLVESQIDNSAPQTVQSSATGFRLTLRKSDRLLKAVGRLKGVLVLSANDAYLIDVPVGIGERK